MKFYCAMHRKKDGLVAATNHMCTTLERDFGTVVEMMRLRMFGKKELHEKADMCKNEND